MSHCFTVSGMARFWCFFAVVFVFGFGLFVRCLFAFLAGHPFVISRDVYLRHLIQDCHYRHDERSNGAKNG